jgi:pyruvate/oxaloacetate carboxyltransferase
MTDELTLQIADETFRDGPQSLWANRLRTRDMLPAAPHAARAGFTRSNLLSGVGFEVAVSFLEENPLDRFRLLRELMGETPSTILVRSRNLFGWTRYADDVVTFCLEHLHSMGLDEFEVFDALNDTRNIEHHIREGARLGMHTSACLTFSESAVHTDDYFATKAKEYAQYGASGILLYDACGVLRPERVAPLVAAIQGAAPGLPVELNVHDQTGLALECYRKAMRVGVTALSTAARPVAGSNSVPATADVIALAREEGVRVDLDEDEVAWMDSYFRFVAYDYGKPQRHDVVYDEENYRSYVGHQIPGGMMSHYVGQLQGLGLIDRLPEVLEEAARVRVDLGCPGMVTPFSQLVGVQAMLNVLDGKRFHTVPADLRAYAAGHYGEPPGAIAPDVLDKILGDEPIVDPMAGYREEMLPGVRAELPADASDDDVFFALFCQPAQVAVMKQQPVDELPVRELSPLGALVGHLAGRDDISRLDVRIDVGR